MREICLDTETTGFDPKNGHKIVEIGCVELINKLPTGKTFHRYLNPQRDVPQEVVNVHGLTADFLKDKPLFKDVANDFLKFIRDDPLIIHNAAFDMRFLNAEFAWINYGIIPMTRAVDTLSMAKQKFPGSPASLDALCKRFDIDLSTRSLHGALLDSQLLAAVYLELCGGRQTIMVWESGGASLNTQEDLLRERPYKPARAFPLTPGEAERHQEMVGRLKNPLWKEIKAS